METKTALNLFANKIYNKKKYTFWNGISYLIHRNSIKRFRNKILKGSPSFDVLWNMSNFIKIAEFSFFYDNSIKNTDFGLYSSKNYQDGTNGFKIITPECIITIKLFNESKSVCITIVLTSLAERILGMIISSFLTISLFSTIYFSSS